MRDPANQEIFRPVGAAQAAAAPSPIATPARAVDVEAVLTRMASERGGQRPAALSLLGECLIKDSRKLPWGLPPPRIGPRPGGWPAYCTTTRPRGRS
jgi:hypothetical protein